MQRLSFNSVQFALALVLVLVTLVSGKYQLIKSNSSAPLTPFY